jgi:DedD protein
MSANPEMNGDDDLKRKLVRRVAFAGLLIALLLGVLAFIDYLGQPGNDSVDSGPTYTSPVPVPKKEVSQPVTPAEPAATVEAPKETTPPPPVVEAPTAAPAGVPPAADTPARPEVSAQPALPRQEPRMVSSLPASSPTAAQPAKSAKSVDTVTPAEGTAAASSSSQFTPDVEKPTTPLPPAARAQPEPPAPPRLFSGFAVQAGVFSDAQRAEELRALLMLNGIPSTLEARVQVGPFKTREEAETARQKLKALGVEGLLLPPRGNKR